MLNKVMLIGNLGRDPELKDLRSRDQADASGLVCSLSVATTQSVKTDSGREERTEWHRVTVWGNQADACAKYLKKGRQVFVEGRLKTSKYVDKDGVTKYSTDVVASRVQFLGKPASDGPDGAARPGVDASAPNGAAGNGSEDWWS